MSSYPDESMEGTFDPSLRYPQECDEHQGSSSSNYTNPPDSHNSADQYQYPSSSGQFTSSAHAYSDSNESDHMFNPERPHYSPEKYETLNALHYLNQPHDENLMTPVADNGNTDAYFQGSVSVGGGIAHQAVPTPSHFYPSEIPILQISPDDFPSPVTTHHPSPQTGSGTVMSGFTPCIPLRDIKLESPSIKRPRTNETDQYRLPQQSGSQSSLANDDHVTKSIQFFPYHQESWLSLYDDQQNALPAKMCVAADKGFDYDPEYSSFINHKRNHFQISTLIETAGHVQPAFVCVNNELLPIAQMQIELRGVKAERQTDEIEVKQSHSNRMVVQLEPAVLTAPEKLESSSLPFSQITIPRLHFEKATENNDRRKGKPNTKQKYYLLLVRLVAVTSDGASYVVLTHNSERIISRAGSPGPFAAPSELSPKWEHLDGLVYIEQSVSIGTNRSYGEESKLNVHGDIVHTGVCRMYCDERLKKDVLAVEGMGALKRIRELRVVEFSYKDDYARSLGMSDQTRHRFGVIAQDLADVYPDSVHSGGEFLTIDENRMFYENIVALQELSAMHEQLKEDIEMKLEKMRYYLSKIIRRKTSCEEDSTSDSVDHGASSWSIATPFKEMFFKETLHRQEMESTRRELPRVAKLTQCTLVTLVGVMAACLLTMTVFYLLDMKSRPIERERIVVHHVDDDIFEEEYADLGLMKKTWVLPRHHPGAPPLHDMCVHAGCRSYCCLEERLYSNETRFGGFNENSASPLMGGSFRSFLSAVAGTEKIAPTAFFPKPFSSGTRIEIEGASMTIDSRYCTDRSCNEKRGRYHLFVPISPYMPTTPIRLRISPPEGLFVQSCGHLSDFEECHDDGVPSLFSLETPTATQVGRDLFDVSAGGYKRSGYRFRVGTSTQSCYSTEHTPSYEEYNIIFYRVCGDNVAETTVAHNVE